MADVRLRRRNSLSPVWLKEGELRLAVCNFVIPNRELRLSVARRTLSLAQSVRIHTTRIPISDIHLSLREDFAIEGDAIVPAVVAIIPWDSHYEMPPGIHCLEASVPFVWHRCTKFSYFRKIYHPFSIFSNSASHSNFIFALDKKTLKRTKNYTQDT